jgi:hypothetical protein
MSTSAFVALGVLTLAMPAFAGDLTCSEWFTYSKQSHLPHGKSETFAATAAAIGATFDTIEALRLAIAKRENAGVPARRNRDEMIRSVVAACAEDEAKPVNEVITRIREVLIDLELAKWAKH